ncbi:transcriptional regulator, IclR family [Actinacidiphila rubida]|uniref:Transcriptional regulator, IclR family n=1 Tax=Actinacidiphila rubida TaxID=310780 RepID=A0A1H8MVR7_9ACTN|nr:helix-turn-helix domain-containing protein [Actinacidiphila rubida]SEO21313.1 transcriptional regulator, IclR family [Actinacidiphila rubida]
MPVSATSAVDKALDLIETVARSDRPLRLSEIADALGMNRATAYRVLGDLVRRRWVLRFGDHYVPGPAVLQLSPAAAAQSLVLVARPVLDGLAQATGMMANLQVLTADRSRVVDVVRPPRLEMISDLRDELLPVHRFSGPLALVAALDAPARLPYLRPAREAGHPLDGPGGLLAALDGTAAGGFALQRGREQPLVASLSRALTAAGAGPICAITLVGPSAEFADPRLPALRAELTTAVDRLGEALVTPRRQHD